MIARHTTANLRVLAAQVRAGLPVSASITQGSAGHVLVAQDSPAHTSVHQRNALDRHIATILFAARVSGAPLSDALESLVRVGERVAEHADRITESLAGPRMARKLIVFLPILAVPLAAALGFDVVTVLVMTPLGWMLLAASAALMTFSHWWSGRLVSNAQKIAPAPGLYPSLLALSLTAGVGISRATRIANEALDTCDTRWLLNPAETERSHELIRDYASTGIPLRGILTAQATTAMDEAFLGSSILSRELGEKLLLPLGLCTLPAFLLLGIVPVLLSVLSSTQWGM